MIGQDVCNHEPRRHSRLWRHFPQPRAGGPVGRTRRAVFEALRQRGIGVNVHYIPVHTQPYYRAMGFNTGDFPESERYYTEAISLPLFPILSKINQDQI